MSDQYDRTDGAVITNLEEVFLSREFVHAHTQVQPRPVEVGGLDNNAHLERVYVSD